jgi:hypothetical protein
MERVLVNVAVFPEVEAEGVEEEEEEEEEEEKDPVRHASPLRCAPLPEHKLAIPHTNGPPFDYIHLRY